jgi:hypothetical protein
MPNAYTSTFSFVSVRSHFSGARYGGDPTTSCVDMSVRRGPDAEAEALPPAEPPPIAALADTVRGMPPPSSPAASPSKSSTSSSHDDSESASLSKLCRASDMDRRRARKPGVWFTLPRPGDCPTPIAPNVDSMYAMPKSDILQRHARSTSTLDGCRRGDATHETAPHENQRNAMPQPSRRHAP